MPLTPAACARTLLDVVPSVMRIIRADIRAQRAELSVPQFRSLLYLARHPGASLREVASHLGLTPPSASRLMDLLERRTLVRRRPAPGDRRRITLVLTPAGSARLRPALTEARRALTARLGRLSTDELDTVMGALSILHRSFAAGDPSVARLGGS
jgi:DNA-binding MarR family transcriptional regulator